MESDHDDREDAISRRHALECMVWAGTGVLWMVSSDAPRSLSPLGEAQAAAAIAQTKPTIPVIVKDTTSRYWQTVLAGARKAGQDLASRLPNWVRNPNPTPTVRSPFLRRPSHR